ncbi:glycosyltransferase family 25 protein [Phenylobacterium sp.]|uniref:glycosyltransferase family 25 protein n=1 Tax=Phenylobacterium sp. TaxID=1871053 RepID=UPI003BAD0D1B
MKCHYINLDTATARRANLEAAFRAVNPAGWELVRIAASGPDAAAGVQGAITATEKACWLSHRRAIEAALGDDEPVVIVEDDVRFSPRTFPILAALATADSEWDLLYSDVILTEISSMVTYARDWPQLARAGNFRMQDLATLPFVGAAGYVVRGGSKRRVLEALDSLPFDRAYDVALRDLIHQGVLQGRACFPFLTAPSVDADASTIQPSQLQFRDAAINAFRRLMFVDRDLEASRRDVAALEAAHGDPAATVLGGVLGALVSSKMP